MMSTISFFTIFSIEKCSVRLGAFGAKLRRVRRAGESSGLQWGLTIIIIHQKIAKFYVFSNEKLRGPMCFLSVGFCRIYVYVYFLHSDRLILAGRPVKNTQMCPFLLSSAGELGPAVA